MDKPSWAAAATVVGLGVVSSWYLLRRTPPRWHELKSDLELQAFRNRGVPREKMNLTVSASAKNDAIAIVACGSFSPPTLAHFRMLEDAKDQLEARGVHVAGGFVSPVHMKYGKKSLAAMFHRVNMVGHAMNDSTWISADPWECSLDEWTRTRLVIDRYQDEFDSLYKQGLVNRPIRAALLGGADLVESFTEKTPEGKDVWAQEDVESICSRGVVCIARDGFDLDAVVKKNEILQRHRNNIHVIYPPIENNISSTLVRKSLAKGWSVKYVVHEAVIEYIKRFELHRLPNWQ